MFREIKKQITLFNIFCLIAFLFLFITLLMFFVQWSFNSSGELYLAETAKEIQCEAQGVKNTIEKTPNLIHNKIGYAYVIWDEEGKAKDMKIEESTPLTKGYEFLIDDPKFNGFNTFNFSNESYRMYTTHFDSKGKQCVLQLFQTITTEQIMMQYVVKFLLILGFCGVLFIIPISYLLAGKSLKPIKSIFENQEHFIADASHELRTPLAVIQTNVEVLQLKKDELLNDNEKWLTNISSEIDKMDRLITDLLFIAQEGNKKNLNNKKQFNLSELCEELVALMTLEAKEKNILLTANIQKNIMYIGDLERIQQAIRIIVDNAIKYTPGDGAVLLDLYKTQRTIYISIKDTGIGLTPEDQKQIFSRFYRVDNSRHREEGGGGLGLSIADMIVRQHHGKIKTESKLNAGSTFTIILKDA